MIRRQLDARQWPKVAAIFRAERGAGRPGRDDRNFIEAVLWWRRTGVRRQDLPNDFGPWKPFFVTESFTGMPGRSVPLSETVAGAAAIVEGRCDTLAEDRLFMIGSLAEVTGG